MKRLHKRLMNLILISVVLIAGLFSSLIQLAAAPANSASQAQPDIMEVHYIDVGQGDSTLIKCGEHAMLIDAGDDSKGTAIQNYLKKQGVKKLDYLVLTHPDSDHIGGAPVIITKFDIGKVFMSNYEKDNKTYQKLIQALDDKNLKYSTPKVGSQYTLGTAKIKILAPNNEYDNPNDSSIALIVQNKNNKFIFTGDATENAEKDIIDNEIDISADVYKAGHHGSSSSSSKEFLECISPTYAVISCAEDNSYGHPHAETLNSLRRMGVQVFRTDEQGSIIAASDGEDITWNCAPSETWKPGESTQNAEHNSDSKSAGAVTDDNTTPVEEPTTIDTPSEASGATTYICNTNTGKFHYPSCSSVDQMSEKNKLAVTATRDELISQGYVPCKRCNP